ncbi:MAG TPA: polymer-forming cytoskeletal protein [Candidatus Paceibacterota bacterium]|nr:polymer-forming cytoskeletal protein [Candidatus Paceibacterota bacterium]
MKKYFFFSLSALAVLGIFSFGMIPSKSYALTLQTGENVDIPAGQNFPENLYAVSGNTTVSGGITGDVTELGGNLVFSGSSTEDALLLGGQVDITGNSGGDMRAAGGNITFSGHAAQDAAFAGGTVHFLSSSRVGKDALILAASTILDGNIGGNTTVYADSAEINGTITGNVAIHAKKISIGPNAVISGNLDYTSLEPASIASGAKILGKTIHTPAVVSQPERSVLATVAGYAVPFFMLLICGLFLGLFFRNASEAILLPGGTVGAWKYFLLGIGVLIFTPIVGLVFLGTVILAPLGGIILFSYAALLVFAWVYAAMFLGNWLFQLFDRRSLLEISWQGIVLGAILFTFIPLIPFVGGIIDFILFLLALGLLSLALGNALIWLRKSVLVHRR